MTDHTTGYTTVHARVRFTERYECRSSKTGTVEVFEVNATVDPLQLDMTGPSTDPTSPDAVWTSEPPDSGVCFDWIYIPGSVLEVLDHWPA